MLKRLAIYAFILLSPLAIGPIYADMITPLECAEKMGRACTCWELGNCQFTEDPLTVMLFPFDNIFGGLSIVIFWAIVISILWLRTESPQLVGIVGIAMTSAYMAYLETNQIVATSEFETARGIGATLLVVSIGIAIYHLLISRILQGPT